MCVSVERHVCACNVLMTAVVGSVYSKNYRMLSPGNRRSEKGKIRTVVFRASDSIKTIEQNLCIIFEMQECAACTYQFTLERSS